jgi:hypothetical protein
MSYTKTQVRRGTAAAWTAANPTLAAGEFGAESDTGYLKLGTGLVAWATLPYFSMGAVAVVTQGSVPFAGAGGTLTEDNDKLFFDATNFRLGIGTLAPTGNLSVTQAITNTGALRGIVYTGAVNTAQTLSTEISAVVITTAGRQWATGALATQREIKITQPTYSFVAGL